MVFESIRRIICEQLNLDEDEVTRESTFIEDLNADSLDIAEMIVLFEEEFNLEIPDSMTDKISTVGDVVDYISDALQ